jgi:hypothetical protein
MRWYLHLTRYGLPVLALGALLGSIRFGTFGFSRGA